MIKTGKVINQVDFSYDAAGNIIEEKTSPEADPQINLEMTYAKANRLASYDDETVQLDADGNLIQGPLSGEMANFVFDSQNRLTQAGETVYRYDAENQRIGVNQTQYVINSQPALSQVLVKTEASGTQTFYVYGLGLIGQETGGEYSSYHFDYRGSTVALTDKTGQVTEKFQYSPYGLLLSGEASTTPFLFNGMYGVMTDDNGLYYMRARFYSPSIRRFVNQDILLGRITEGQTLNRYAYVTGQPVSYVDPFGLSGDIPFYREDKTVGYLSFLLEFYFFKGLSSCSLVYELPMPTPVPNVDIEKNIDMARKCWNPIWFYDQVRNKGPWDYKQQGSQYEDFGNFNFGATGCAFGFPSEILLRGAGWAQQRAGTSKEEHGNWWDNPPYADDPKVQEMIQLGIQYCKCRTDFEW